MEFLKRKHFSLWITMTTMTTATTTTTFIIMASIIVLNAATTTVHGLQGVPTWM